MADPTPARPTPIYVSYLTFTTLLDWLRELKTLPSQFDRSFWGHKFSGSGGGQLMGGLRFLGLLNGDKPENDLETLALADDADRKALLIELLRKRYGAEFIDSLPHTTPRLVNERLRELGTTDATHDKARSFFVNAAKAVDLALPPQVAKQARNRPSVSRKPAKKKGGGGEGTTPRVEDKSTEDNPPPIREDKNLTGLPEPLAPFIKDLIRIGPSWDQASHDRWLATFTMVLDYTFPAKKREDEPG